MVVVGEERLKSSVAIVLDVYNLLASTWSC